MVVDVTNRADVAKAARFVQDNLDGHKMWAVINNAGVLRGGAIDTQPFSDWQLQMNVNVFGIVHVTRAFLPMLIESKGRVVNIASVAGYVALADTSSYSASKFAVEGMSDALRRELKPWGVTVTIVEPGIMKTPLWDVPLSEDELLRRQFDDCPAEVQAKYGKAFTVAKHRAAGKLVGLVAGNPQQVVDRLDACVRNRHTGARYGVGIDIVWFDLLKYAPVCVSDWLLEMQEKVLMGGVKAAALTKKN